ncbi:MAG: hypothetical protein AB1941_01920 [Gemmatimonadota bacterium]
MESLTDLERGIRDTEGVPVAIGEVATWGHADAVAVAGFGVPGATGTPALAGVAPLVRVVTVPRQPLPALQVGAEIMVDGAAEVVRSFAPVAGDPALLAVLLFDWTHVVSVYRPEGGSANDRGRRREGWGKVREGVRGILFPGPADTESAPPGEVPTTTARGFFLAGADLQPRDGLLVEDGPGPVRYRVDAATDFGAQWGVVATLTVTPETFP